MGFSSLLLLLSSAIVFLPLFDGSSDHSAPPHENNFKKQKRFMNELPATHVHNRYDEDLANMLMYVAAAAYANETLSMTQCMDAAFPATDEWTAPKLFEKECDLVNDTCVFFTTQSHVRRQVVMSFRGTNSVDQLIVIALNGTVPEQDFHGNGKVMHYFFRGLEVLWPSILSVLNDLRWEKEGYKVIFTGHSLGGAFASLAAHRAVVEGILHRQQVLLYTFGQPRVGNGQYAFNHDRNVPHSYRLVNSMDVVPHLPLCCSSFRPDIPKSQCNASVNSAAYHHGTEIWYPIGMKGVWSRRKICLGKPRNEDEDCSDSLHFHYYKPSEWKSYIWDHRHYFDEEISIIGHTGCKRANGKKTHALIRKFALLLNNRYSHQEYSRRQHARRKYAKFQALLYFN